MATRTLTLGDIGSWDAEPGSPPWVKRTHIEALSYIERAELDVKHLEVYIASLQRDNNFQKLTDANGQHFMLWEDYCTARPPLGLGYSPSALQALVHERKTAQARVQDAAQATTGEVLPPHRLKGEEVPNLGTSSQSKRAQANGVSRYTQQKLDCLSRHNDGGALLAAVRRGEISVDAGYRLATGVPNRITVTATVDGFVRAAQKNLTAAQVRALIEALS